MKKQLTILFFLTFLQFCFSQKIKGVVLNASTKKPVEKALVTLSEKKFFTNSKGEFTFNETDKNNLKITIKHINYQPKTLFYNKEIELPFIILLKEKSEQLKGIFVNTNRRKKNNISYSKLENLPKGVYGFASSIKNDKIYLFGGDISSVYEKNKEGLSEQVFFSNEEEIMKVLKRPKPISFNSFIGDFQVYDISRKKWYYKKDKFLKRAYHNSVVFNNNVYLIGGKSLSKKKYKELLRQQIEVFSLKDSLIALDQTNPHQAINFGSSVYKDKILVYGGSIKVRKNGNKVYSKAIHMYDIKTGNWYLLTKMLKAKEVKGIIFKDKLYLFGGFADKQLTEITSFNLLTGRWKKEGDLFKGMRNPSLTKDNEFIYIQEGGRILTFEPETKVLKSYSIDLPLEDARIHYYKENLYLLGGFYTEDYRKAPSSSFLKIDILEFLIKEPINKKNFRE